MDVSSIWFVVIAVLAAVLTAAAGNPKWPGVTKIVDAAQIYVFVAAALWIVLVAVRSLVLAFR